MSPTPAVQGTWCRPSFSASVDVEAHPITGTYAPFSLPSTPEPARAAPTRIRTHTPTDAIDDFFGLGVARPCITRGSQHDVLPPPPYTDAELPAYSAETHTEPNTLAKYLFKFGFLFPPLWVLGTIILVTPLTAPADFEASKSGAERQQLVQIIRGVELRWAKRCACALLALLALTGIVVLISLAVLHSWDVD